MLHLVRSNSPYTVLILAIFTLLLKLQALSYPLLPVADAHHALFGYIVRFLKYFFGNRPVPFTVLATAFTFGQALYLANIAGRHRLFTRPSYLPAFAYIVLSSLHPVMGQFSVFLVLNWVLLGSLDTFLYFTRREEPQSTVYNAGFLLGCAAALHFPAVIYSLLFLMALLWLRTFRPAEWVVGLLGYATPFYFAVGLLYLGDNLPVVRSWPHMGSALPQSFKSPYLVAAVAGPALLLVSGVLILMRQFFRIPVSVRRGWGAIGTALAVSIAVSALSTRAESSVWVGTLPFLSLLVVLPMLGEKRSRFATFTFYFLLALVIFCQVALRR